MLIASASLSSAGRSTRKCRVGRANSGAAWPSWAAADGASGSVRTPATGRSPAAMTAAKNAVERADRSKPLVLRSFGVQDPVRMEGAKGEGEAGVVHRLGAAAPHRHRAEVAPLGDERRVERRGEARLPAELEA